MASNTALYRFNKDCYLHDQIQCITLRAGIKKGEKTPMIRVVIADDHKLVREGIRAILEKAQDIEVVGEASDGQEALDLTESLSPDVLVIDIAMPRLSGIEAIYRLKRMHSNTQVVVLTIISDANMVRQALHAGARGYLIKRSASEELLLAIRAASQSHGYLSPEVLDYVMDNFLSTTEKEQSTSLLGRLTSREREVLQFIVEGNTNAEIAKKLSISKKTVEKHRTSLMSKLAVHDLAELLRVAIKEKLVFLD